MLLDLTALTQKQLPYRLTHTAKHCQQAAANYPSAATASYPLYISLVNV
jgi:hypothetical protein